MTYYINRSDMAQAATIQNEVTEAVNAYVLWQRSDIGKDINPSELEHRIRAAGAKRAVIRSPGIRGGLDHRGSAARNRQPRIRRAGR